ncbi:uncharacterized protein LOC113517208 isoform X2 [Galleria mellonella]|uniref:Uncharacterized protein LOC113517208 isoform X2 n=1 Tax=Galleria mellonella TaxID=7137 RepID=A0A6J1WXB7_GALME|nr:uncharacterized protein LOC113517208 isoform X2 [Galleria mellonella]
MSKYESKNKTKFTRGEKCLFIHITITFTLIIILLIVFFVHLCLVGHKGNEVFKISQRHAATDKPSHKLGLEGVGVVYLNITPVRIICVSLLLRDRWSVAPGHCVSIRTEPEIANLLQAWKIRYRTNAYKDIETDIKTSLVHPHFNRDDFNNNIGLFEHKSAIILSFYEFHSFVALNNKISFTNTPKYMKIVTWDLQPSQQKGDYRSIIMNTNIVKGMSLEQCRQTMSPIVELRNNEFCVMIDRKSKTVIVPGAVIFINSKVLGFFSWGPKQAREEPIVILNIFFYRAWLKYTILK